MPKYHKKSSEIKYIDGETEKVHCPLCKQEYSINHLELITKK